MRVRYDAGITPQGSRRPAGSVVGELKGGAASRFGSVLFETAGGSL